MTRKHLALLIKYKNTTDMMDLCTVMMWLCWFCALAFASVGVMMISGIIR